MSNNVRYHGYSSAITDYTNALVEMNETGKDYSCRERIAWSSPAKGDTSFPRVGGTAIVQIIDEIGELVRPFAMHDQRRPQRQPRP